MPDDKPLSENAKRHLDSARRTGVLRGAPLAEMVAELGRERVLRLSRTSLFSIEMPPGGLASLPEPSAAPPKGAEE